MCGDSIGLTVSVSARILKTRVQKPRQCRWHGIPCWILLMGNRLSVARIDTLGSCKQVVTHWYGDSMFDRYSESAPDCVQLQLASQRQKWLDLACL